ncbi:MAG: universal stress protein [Rhodobacteraceae bacterium]|nr:universal stress protein [Paracoccaceae bacterium]
MYKHILVPVAYEQGQSVGPALEIAQALVADGARITLMHVIDEIPPYAISYMPKDYRSELKEAIRADLATQAKGIAGAEVAVDEGDASRTILDWAERNAVDCIVISSHRPGIQDYFLGSTAARVVRHAQCAVHVVR